MQERKKIRVKSLYVGSKDRLNRIDKKNRRRKKYITKKTPGLAAGAGAEPHPGKKGVRRRGSRVWLLPLSRCGWRV